MSGRARRERRRRDEPDPEPEAEPQAAPPDAAGGKGSFTRPGDVLTTSREGAPSTQVEPQDPERDPAAGEQARRASDDHPSLREDERPRRRGDSGRDAAEAAP